MLICPVVHIFRFTLSIEGGISALKSRESAGIAFGRGEVKDMKFLDNNILLVLLATSGKLTHCWAV